VSGAVVVVATAITSAALYAMSSAAKHASAQATPRLRSGSHRGLARFARATVTHRLWLLGIVFDAGGLALQVIALHLGSLVVVQPLLISGLIFALLLRRASGRHHVSGRQLGWATLLVVALAAFIALAAQHGSSARVDRLPALIAGVAGLAAVAVCIVLGRRLSTGGGAAALLGTAVGVIYAATAALLKVLSNIAIVDPLRLLTAWQLYVTIALGVGGLLLNQLAFQAGPLAASLPASSAVDPLASIAIGVVVFDEQVRRLTGAGLLLFVLLGVLAFSIVALARANPVDANGDHANRRMQNSPAARQ
jgi:drug/metabolite transporter (DMT)-like permease